MERIRRFGTVHPLPFVILAMTAWLVTAGATAYLAARVLHVSPVDGLAQSLGTLTATACVLLAMWRWGWLRAAGVTALGSWRLWLATAVIAAYVVSAYQLAFFGRIVVSDSALWAAGEAQALLLRNAVVGVVEELLFRGLLLYALVRVWGRTRRGLLAAVSVSALIFGLLHIMQTLSGNSLDDTLMTMANAFVGGVWFGALVLLGGSVWPAALIHAAGNFVVQFGAMAASAFDPGLADFAEATLAEAPLVIIGLWLLLRQAPGSFTAEHREQGGASPAAVSSAA
jgi:membrane protease YdiL (CAAX protease family)